jgi:hypothetical protein
MKKRTTKPKLIFRTQFNSKPYTGKKMDPTVLTQPDQNMGIRELLDKHSRGLPLGVTENKGEYFDTEIPKFDDILDAVEYKKMLSKKHKELEAQIKADQESAKAKEKALESKATSVQALDTKSVSSETQQKG